MDTLKISHLILSILSLIVYVNCREIALGRSLNRINVFGDDVMEGSGETTDETTMSQVFTTSEPPPMLTGTPAPESRPPPPVPSTELQMQFEILYQPPSNSILSLRRLSSEQPEILSSQQDARRTRLQLALTDAFKNATGFVRLQVTEVPHENCTGECKYTAGFDSNKLTEDCRTRGCQLKSELEQIRRRINEIGSFGNCRMDEAKTKEKMSQEINHPRVSRVISNPCLMTSHRCASLGPQYTCMYSEPALYCLNVCKRDFCGGGECHADHSPNNGYDGKAKCSCASFRFLSGDRCVTWWSVFGPLLAVSIIAILLVVVIIVMKTRRNKDEKKNYATGSKNIYDNPVFNNSLGKAGTSTPPAFLAEEADYMSHYYQMPNPKKANEDDLHKYASLTATELEKHPDNKDFKPQLDRVDTSKEYKIARPKQVDKSSTSGSPNDTGTGMNVVYDGESTAKI